MKQLPTDGRPFTFLGLVTVLSLPLFVLGAVAEGIEVGSLVLPSSALMFVLPVLAAAILTYRDNGKAGVIRLLRRAFDYSVAPRKRWYLVALLAAIVPNAAAYGLARAFGSAESQLPMSLAALPIVVIVMLIAAACEELGWTAYATDPLQERFGTPATGMILGIFWAAWHLLPLVQAGHDSVWIAGWFIGTVAARMVIVWLHNNTGHGVLAAIFMHAAINVCAALTPGYDQNIIPVLTGVIMALLALAVTVRPTGTPIRMRIGVSKVI